MSLTKRVALIIGLILIVAEVSAAKNYVQNQAILVVEPSTIDRVGLIPDNPSDRAKIASISAASASLKRDLREGLKRLGVRKVRFTLKSEDEMNPKNQRTGLRADLRFGRNWVLVDLPEGTDFYSVEKELHTLPGVSGVMPNEICQLLATPNDSYYGSQWALPKCRLPQVWDNYKVNNTVVVGTYDATGIKGNHSDLAGNLHPNSVTNTATYNNDNKHGTKTAGIVCAATDNGAMVAGVAWNAKIHMEGGNSSMATFDIFFGIADLVATSDVIYYSFGDIGYHALDSTVDAVDSAGIFQCGGAGNDMLVLDSSSYFGPGGHPKVVMVGATEEDDTKWVSELVPGKGTNYYSNNANVDKILYAPGSSVYTTTFGSMGDFQVQAEGTSYATPFVAGVAALMLKKNPSLTPAQIRSTLLSSATVLSWPGGKIAKRVDAKSAVDAVSTPKLVVGSAVLPPSSDMGPNFPNPFNAETMIPFSLDAPSLVELHIYNLAGQLVREINLGYQAEGLHMANWNGKTQNGESVATGIYLYRLLVNENSIATRRLLLLR